MFVVADDRRAGRRGVAPHARLRPGRRQRRTAVSFADIAVLYRTDAQAAPIVDALTRAGIPVQKRSHDRLLDRAGVAAIARELRFAAGLGGSLAARVRLAAQVLAERAAGAGRPAASAGGPVGGRRRADAAGAALRRRPGRVPRRAGDRRRGGRLGPARRPGHAADPARREGPGVPGGVPGRLRGRAAAAALPGRAARRRTRPRSGGCSSSG